MEPSLAAHPPAPPTASPLDRVPRPDTPRDEEAAQEGASRTVTAAELRAAVAALPDRPDWARCVAACRTLDRLGPAPDALRARIAVAGSSTLEPLAPFLRVEGARAGIWVEPLVAPYGLHFQELLDPGSALHAHRPHVTLLLLDADLLWEMRWADGTPRGGPELVAELLRPIEAALEAFERHGSGILLVADLAPIRRPADGPLGFRDEHGFARTLAAANEAIRAALAARPGAYLFPLADTLAELGRERAVQWRGHYRGHVTWSDAMMAELARRTVAYALGALGRATKCIVLDLDHTLWGGVLGEDGPEGIAVGPATPGREYLDLQRQLLELHRQGILLALCSKNDEREALAVLRDHPGMRIRPHHLAAHRIDWEDKATNIRALARELDLGLEHLLFLDDSPHERAWVRSQLPEVLVPEPPDDPARWADWLASLPSLAVLQRTEEDAHRTRQYQERRAREEFRRQAGSLEEFLRGLGLRATVEEVDERSYARVAQLLARTNQFNLTTRRHDERTLRRRVAAGEWRVYTLALTDVFGDFGLTGAAVVEPRGAEWHIDSFVLSCRVIGKSAESALLARIAEDARAAGATTLTAEFIESGRNEPARAFLPTHGFTLRPDGLHARPLADGGPAWPDWIARNAREEGTAG